MFLTELKYGLIEAYLKADKSIGIHHPFVVMYHSSSLYSTGTMGHLMLPRGSFSDITITQTWEALYSLRDPIFVALLAAREQIVCLVLPSRAKALYPIFLSK